MTGRPHIDVDLMAALNALLIERNVTRAAERLGLSQPALSSRLTRLRELFGDRLFVPSPNGRGVLPTPRALALAPQVAAVLDQMAAMLEPPAFEAATSNATFTIACHENPAVMLSPDLVPRLQRAAPGVRLLLALPSRERMPELLENGNVDLFVGTRDKGEEAWLSRTLFGDSFVVAQRRLHPRGAGPLDIDAYCDASHLIVSAEGDPFSGVVDEALAARGRRRRIAVSLESYAVAPTIIAASDLLCTLPRRFLARYADILDLFEPPIELPPVEIAAYWHPRAQEDAAHQWLRAEVFAAASAIGRGRCPG